MIMEFHYDNPTNEIIREIVSKDIEEMLRSLKCKQAQDLDKGNYKPDEHTKYNENP